MKYLQKEIKLNIKLILILLLINIFVIGFYYSYALFEISVIQNSVVKIETASITINLTSSNLVDNKTLSLSAKESKEISLTIENTSSIDAKALLYYISNTEDITFESETTFIDEENIVIGKLLQGESVEISLTITNNTSNEINLELGCVGGLIGYDLILLEGKNEVVIKNETGADVIISQLGSGGLVAVGTDGSLYSGSGEIREYRYTGLGNYCTYTDGTNNYNMNVSLDTCPTKACKVTATSLSIFPYDTDYWTYQKNLMPFPITLECSTIGDELTLKTSGSSPVDSGLRNYIEFNGELWRIVGIFDGSLKIVKDVPFLNDIYSSANYTSDGKTYLLKFEPSTAIGGDTKYGHFFYNPVSFTDQFQSATYINDWSTSSIMHYLNDESVSSSYYVKKLSTEAKNLIQETTYYLGNVSSMTTVPIQNTYLEERKSTKCSSSVTSNSNTNNCNVWSSNQSSWSGKIGLLYPSDILYSIDTVSWNNSSNLLVDINESWLLNTDVANFWLLSPSSTSKSEVWYYDAWELFISSARDGANQVGASGVRPCLYLKPEVIITSGDGSLKNPYKLSLS